MEFLLEINTEEMPASHIKSALSQLDERFQKELTEEKVVVNRLQTHGTCRRLVVRGDFAPSQKDREEEVIGPPSSIAFSPEGKPTPAALGFAKAQNVSLDELKVIQTDRGEYLGLRKIEKGLPTQNILIKIVPQIISALSFPKMMRWGKNPFRFSRPIKNILCLFSQRPLSFSVGDVKTVDFTWGHKIFSPRKIKVKDYHEYESALKQNKVIVEERERKKIILNQAKKKLTSLKAQLFTDEELLEKLTYDVEYPYVFLGSFPKVYLRLPIEILSTAMKEGQNLFTVVKGKRQLSRFVGVADNFQDPENLIRKGNERVLKARLEDAKFFWQQDLKSPLKEKSSQLKHILFQEKLGSFEDKTKRLKKVVTYLGNKISDKKIKKELMLAAELSKADLLTDMVREFPSLQGKVGGLYAKEEGYSSSVWKAIYEQYQPLSLDEEPPSTLSGAILSVADKMDSIVGVLGIGIEVTGSKDPFGLRRNAHGACKVILEKKFSFSFPRFLDILIKGYGDRLILPKNEIKNYCLEFFQNRLQYIYEREGYSHDLIKAALVVGMDDIYHSYLRLKSLDTLKDSSHFEPMILIAKRVNNILRDQPKYRINPDLFTEKEEKELYTTFSIIKKNVLPLIAEGDYLRAQRFIFRMRSVINSFFDNVLVMTEEKRLRRNRLALLQGISKLFLQVADYSRVVVEGQNKSNPKF
jgi:glycyl-tRNA synthetase beta chain